MKIHLNNRLALYYPGSNGAPEEMAAFLTPLRIEMRLVEPAALALPVAAVAGYLNTKPPTLTFDGEPPAESCIVFTGLTEEKLNRTLDKLKSNGPQVDCKAVITADNRDWAFGALLQNILEEEKQAKEATP